MKPLIALTLAFLSVASFIACQEEARFHITNLNCEYLNNPKGIDATEGLDEKQSLAQRQKLIRQFDEEDIMATPKNSAYNELVMEAGRLSILNGGKEVEITYGENAGVKLRD